MFRSQVLVILSLLTYSCGTKTKDKQAVDANAIPWSAKVVSTADLGIQFPIVVSGNSFEVTHTGIAGALMSYSEPKDQGLIDYCGFAVDKGTYTVTSVDNIVTIAPASGSHNARNFFDHLEFSSTAGSVPMPSTHQKSGEHAWLYGLVMEFQVIGSTGVARDVASSTTAPFKSDDHTMLIHKHCSRQVSPS